MKKICIFIILLFLLAACALNRPIESNLNPAPPSATMIPPTSSPIAGELPPELHLDEAPENPILTPLVGGLSCNMLTYGKADSDGDIIVYVWEEQIIRVDMDGANRMILSEDRAQNICIYEGWIFYRKIGRTSDPINGIYKMKKDGSMATQITSDTTQRLYVVGDWIYYEDWEYGINISRIRTDGSEKEILYPQVYECLSTDGEYLYFSNFHEDYYVRAPMDGGPYEIIIPYCCSIPVLHDGWIYYQDSQDYLHYRVRTDGTCVEPTQRKNNKLFYGNDTHAGKWGYEEENSTIWTDYHVGDYYQVGNMVLFTEKEYYDEDTYNPDLKNKKLWLWALEEEAPILLEEQLYLSE